ncbi:MAG: S-layer homology domain-containing protein [Firmicutes bacterium]|nr:S-layer homology domain-containing protein [Bacillota bacterium]
MRRAVSLTLVLLLAIMSWMPVKGLAQDDKALEQAIRVVKAKIQVPESLSEFNYNAISEGEGTTWYLDWSSKDRLEGSLSVRVDDKGTILSYNYYKPYDYDSTRKFPKISRHEAQGTAEAFIEKMKPGLLSGLELAEQGEVLQIGRIHSFSYVRLENGISYHANTVNVDVNSETGEVESYYYNWSEDVSFPEPEGIISLEDAQQAYKEELGLKLIYEYNYEDGESRVYAVYVPVYGSNYGVDALSGERIRINPYYGVYPLRGADEAVKEKSMADAPSLTPEEQRAVEEMSSMVSKDKAESIARGIKELEISRAYKVTGAYLQKDWGVKDSYTWEFNFQKEDADKDAPSNIWVRLNARSGELKGYTRYIPTDRQREGKYTEEKAKAEVEKFLKAVCGDKFGDMEFDTKYEGHYYPLGRDKNPASFSFRYIRKINGVQFPDNSAYVSFDGVNGKVTSFSMDWFDIEFPSVESTLEVDEVYETMFDCIGVELVYSGIYEEGSVEPDARRKHPEIKLVYNVKQDKPVIFDAFTGEILDYSGKPYVERKAASYTDIDGHFAKNQIASLAEYGISLPGTEFRPNEGILQKDFLWFLAKAMGYYGSFDDDDALDDMYSRLIREKVLTSDEKNPEASVTREEAVKFIVRSLKYQDVADIKGIFVTGFKDQGSMGPDLVGYVAIAKGLGIVSGSGGNFNPKKSVTRAEAAVMLYNYLIR